MLFILFYFVPIILVTFFIFQFAFFISKQIKLLMYKIIFWIIFLLFTFILVFTNIIWENPNNSKFYEYKDFYEQNTTSSKIEIYGKVDNKIKISFVQPMDNVNKKRECKNLIFVETPIIEEENYNTTINIYPKYILKKNSCEYITRSSIRVNLYNKDLPAYRREFDEFTITDGIHYPRYMNINCFDKKYKNNKNTKCDVNKSIFIDSYEKIYQKRSEEFKKFGKVSTRYSPLAPPWKNEDYIININIKAENNVSCRSYRNGIDKHFVSFDGVIKKFIYKLDITIPLILIGVFLNFLYKSEKDE